VGFDANFLVLMAVLALVFWTIGRKREELRLRVSRPSRLAACLNLAADSGPLAPGVDPEAFAAATPARAVTRDVAGDLRRIAAVDGSFDADRFLEGARRIYEATVLAFAKGDRELLADLLTVDVYRTFLHSIALREARQQRMSLRFVCLKDATIEDAAVADGQVQIVVAFDSEIITATRDAANAVIEGDLAAVVAVADRWTFMKPLRGSGFWRLAATETPRGVPAGSEPTRSVEMCG
jgi:predicted lipid-binding transport protein (Tim44 family)